MSANGLVLSIFFGTILTAMCTWLVIDIFIDNVEESNAANEQTLQEEELVGWIWPTDFITTKPPEPIFNSEDSQTCKDGIEQLYTQAAENHAGVIADNQKLQNSYRKILQNQETYDIELSNNSEFEEWSKQQSMIEFGSDQASDLSWTASVKQFFSFSLRTEEEVDEAINALYWWRVNNDLESAPVECNRRRLQDQANNETAIYDECSVNTQVLGDILIEYTQLGKCDNRAVNFYPLLDQIVTWMDNQ